MRLPKEPLRKILDPEEKRLTFGEHLEELRAVFLRSIIAVFLLSIVCFIFQEQLMILFRKPYDRMMASVEAKMKDADPEYRTADELRQDLASLREKVSDPAIGESLDRISHAVVRQLEDSKKLHTIKPTTVFIAHLKVAVIAALFLASPFILYQFWTFIGAGLLPDERRWVRTFLPVSLILFAMGITFGFLLLIPIGLTFLAGYGGGAVVNSFTLDHYLSLVVTLTLVLGVVFELPLVMIFTTRTGIFGPRDYARYRRYSLLFAVVAAAILTPPDPATQMLLAVPLVILYEAGIWMARIFGGSKEG